MERPSLSVSMRPSGAARRKTRLRSAAAAAYRWRARRFRFRRGRLPARPRALWSRSKAFTLSLLNAGADWSISLQAAAAAFAWAGLAAGPASERIRRKMAIGISLTWFPNGNVTMFSCEAFVAGDARDLTTYPPGSRESGIQTFAVALVRASAGTSGVTNDYESRASPRSWRNPRPRASPRGFRSAASGGSRAAPAPRR